MADNPKRGQGLSWTVAPAEEEEEEEAFIRVRRETAVLREN
jgi:hypothetical protein